MSDYRYLITQLEGALSDSPGGEKAWVPIRRCLVTAILEQLQQAEANESYATQMQNVFDRMKIIEQSAPKAATENKPQQTVEPQTFYGRGLWDRLDRTQRIEAIRLALLTGNRPKGMPDRRVWKRHYPEAFEVGSQL